MSGSNALAALRYQGGVKSEVQVNFAAIPTTVGMEGAVIVPEDGMLESIDFSGADNLVAHDTNYIAFYVTNLGQNGTGNVAMLATGLGNTTKLTGGSALTNGSRRKLTISTTHNLLKVKKGDRLRVSAQVFGTLPNTITLPVFMLRFVA